MMLEKTVGTSDANVKRLCHAAAATASVNPPLDVKSKIFIPNLCDQLSVYRIRKTKFALNKEHIFLYARTDFDVIWRQNSNPERY